MLDFENALMALYDEDRRKQFTEFFDRLTDLYITIFGRMIDAYPDIDGFSIHDDWGSQKETFFSPELCAEMIVPYMRRVTDFLHSRGKTAELHSCGQNIKQVPNMIAAGWDAWFPQNIVDSQLVYEMYGDKILVGVDPGISAEGKTEDEMRKAARDFVDRFMQPGKPCFYHYNLLPARLPSASCIPTSRKVLRYGASAQRDGYIVKTHTKAKGCGKFSSKTSPHFSRA